MRLCETWRLGVKCSNLVAIVLVTLSAIGCDTRPRRVPITGKVLIDSQPLTKGFVTVIPADGRPATGQIQKDGSFRLTTFDENDGCLLGTHPVTVVANQQITPTRMKWLAPKKYADYSTSDLKITVDKPRDDIVLELTWSGGNPFVEESGSAGDINPVTSKPDTNPPAKDSN